MNETNNSSDPQGPNQSAIKTGAVLMLVGMVSRVAGLLPPEINSLVICVGLAIIVVAFGAAGVIRSRTVVVRGAAGIAIALFVSVEYLRCDEAAPCDCAQAPIFALWDRVLPG
jgi:hypothetical protein